MCTPTVTVLMTAFNTEAFIGDAVRSILAQTHSDLELVIIDDGSTDASWEAAAAASSGDPRVRMLRNERRGGAGAGLNTGLSVAAGELITRQDSDDMSMPTRIAAQVEFLRQHPQVGAVGTQARVMDETGRTAGTTEFPLAAHDIREQLHDHMCLVGPSIMVRRTVMRDIGWGFDAELSGSEDYDLSLRVAEVAPVANLADALYLYRQHGDSVSRRQCAMQMFRKARALEKAVARRRDADERRALLTNAARDYLKAAVIAHGSGEPVSKDDCVARAGRLAPPLFSRTRALEGIVRRLTPEGSSADALRFTESLFDDVLPRTRRMRRLRDRLAADIHMRVVFATRDVAAARGHLWPAIRRDPRWLWNRGVLSLAVRSVLARATRKGAGAPCS